MKSNRLAYCLLGIVAAAYLVLMLAVAPMYDDLMYGRFLPLDDVRRWSKVLTPANSSVADALESFVNHTQVWNNARLANLLAFLFMLLPPWVPDVVSALCFAVVIASMTRLASPERRLAPLPMALTSAAFFLFVTMRGDMLTADFQMNYVWTTAATLPLILALTGTGRINGWHILWALAAGLMHEGLAAVFGSGLAVWWITARLQGKPLSWRHTAVIAIYLAAVPILLSAPATQTRIAGTVAWRLNLTEIVYSFRLPLRYVPVLFIITLMACRRVGLRSLVADAPTLIFVTAAAVAIPVNTMTIGGQGALFP